MMSQAFFQYSKSTLKRDRNHVGSGLKVPLGISSLIQNSHNSGPMLRSRVKLSCNGLLLCTHSISFKTAKHDPEMKKGQNFEWGGGGGLKF